MHILLKILEQNKNEYIFFAEGGNYKMPIYVLKCEDCKHEFDCFQKNINEDVKYVCSKCKSTNIKKIVAQTSFILKGSGWARDNYTKNQK